MKRGKDNGPCVSKSMLGNDGNRYAIAVLAGKRAREILNGSEPLVDCKSLKPVTIAMKEIAKGKITYKRTKEGIK